MKPKYHNLVRRGRTRCGNETPYYRERRRERTKKGVRRNAALGVVALRAGRPAVAPAAILNKLGILYGPHRVCLGGRTYLIHPTPGKQYKLELDGEDLFSGTFNEVLRMIWSHK